MKNCSEMLKSKNETNTRNFLSVGCTKYNKSKINHTLSGIPVPGNLKQGGRG